jgi:hypothetical protein
MWMSNLIVVVDRRNADRNSLLELAAAVAEAGATVISVDEQSHTIEAATPSHEVPTIRAMEGVSYVRSVFNYFVSPAIRQAA